MLQLLTTKFTALQNNSLWIAGESYAGIYVPQLALRLDMFINATKPSGKWVPNFKGMLVGNGVTNWKYDCTPAYFHMGYYHGLVSDELYNNVQQNCDLSYFDAPTPGNLSAQCEAWMDKFAELTEDVNVYDVFGKCYSGPNMEWRTRSVYEVTDAPSEHGLTASKYSPFLRHLRMKKKNLKVIPPCVYAKPILDYFNNQTTRDALHILPQVGKWDLCADDFNYTSAQNASQWIYPILQGRYQILKYSGDTDGAVPTYGTQQWINELNWEIKDAWRPYYITNMYGQ